MPKIETQTVKVQDVRKDDIITWHDVKHTVTGKTTKTKFVYVDTTTPGTALRIEHGTDVQVERQVQTAAEKYSDMKAHTVDEINDEVRRARAARDKARAKLVEHIEKDYRIDYFELGSLAEADARWEIFVHLEKKIGEAATDDEVIELARHLIDDQREKLLGNRYRGGSSSSMSNTLDEYRREVASELAGPHGFSITMYLRMLDHAEVEMLAESAATSLITNSAPPA